MADQPTVANGIKLLGEIFVPGASQLLEGKVGSGLAHNVIAGVAGAALVGVSPLLAGLAVLAVKANSFSKSVSNTSLLEMTSSAVDDARERVVTGSGSRRAEGSGRSAASTAS